MAAAYQLGAGSGVQRNLDGAWIPADPRNTDWRGYQAWLGQGGVPDPYVPPPPPPPPVCTAPLSIASSKAGSNTGPFAFNTVAVNPDSIAIDGLNFGIGLNVVLVSGGANMTGGRETIQGLFQLKTPSSPNSGNRNYVGIQGIGSALSDDGGTDLTFANAKGAIFGMSGYGALGNGAVNFLNVTGAEFNMAAQAGSSVRVKSCIALVEHDTDAVSGSVIDCLLDLGAVGGAIGLNTLICINDAHGMAPLKTTGTILKALGVATVAQGFDLSTYSFTSWLLNSPNVKIAGQAPGGYALFQYNSGSAGPNTTGATVGFAFSGNKSNGSGEVNFYNTRPTSTLAFEFEQATGINTYTSLFGILANGILATKNWTPNGTAGTPTLTNLLPTGAHTTVQEWFTVQGTGGALRYIPGY